MRNNLENFLIDKNRNNEIFENSVAIKFKIYKEKINDRFDTIYYKREYNEFSQANYNVGGYFDNIDKCLYDASYQLEDMFSVDKKIKMSNFSNIERNISNELDKMVESYLNNNKNIIKKDGKKKFDYLNEYDIKRIKSGIDEIYITQSNPTVKLKFDCSLYSLNKLKILEDKNIYTAYLDNPEKLVNEIFSELIVKYKEELGFEALTYDYKIKYLGEISRGNNPDYKQLNINRNIYQSLKDLYAKTITINIGYGENNLNFKFDLDNLKRSLSNGERSASGYGSFYNRVSDFIKNNDPNRDNYSSGFEFSHINFITYGKNEVYNKDNFKEKIKVVNKNRKIMER